VRTVPEDDLLSVDEAAQLLKVSPDTVRRAFDRGEISGQRTSADPRAHRRLNRASVLAYGEQLRGGGGQPPSG
jgi:excisionase family DNA binding protein